MSLFNIRKFWPKHFDNNAGSNESHSSSSNDNNCVVEETAPTPVVLIQPAATASEPAPPADEAERTTTPFSCYRMSKRNEPSHRAPSLSVTIPIKRRKTIEEKGERERSKSCIASWTGHTEGINIVVAPPFLHTAPVPKDASVEKLVAFLNMCDKHEEFLMRSAIVDKFLIAMVLIYFERARLTAIGYTKDRYFFYALFLAMEMEEDAVDGLSEVIYYVVGNIPPRSTTPGVLSEAEQRWNQRLIKFYKGKDRFWGRLGFRTFVSREDCVYVAQHFPKHMVLRKTRTEKDLQALKKF